MSGAIIKADDSQLRTKGLYSLDLRDISREAEAMLTSAREEAQRIIEEARRSAAAEKDSIRHEARDDGRRIGVAEGLAAGRQTGLEEARKQFTEQQASLLSALTKTLADFTARREEFLAAARRDVVVLAISIASRICQRLTGLEDVTSEIAVQACGEALDHVNEAADVSVRVHPADAAAIERLTEGLAAAFGKTRRVRLMEDASVGRGSVRVETEDTKIDATVVSRIERIADELVQHWRQREEALGIEH